MKVLDEERNGERAYTVDQACELLGGMSRSTFYTQVRAGRIHTRKDGSRTLVLASEITRYLRDLPAACDGD